MANVIVPSRRRLTPAITRDSSAAEGASKSRTEIMSLSSCGVAICPIPQVGTHIENKHSGYRQPAWLHSRCGLPGLICAPYVKAARLSHSSCSVRDPELDQT